MAIADENFAPEQLRFFSAMASPTGFPESLFKLEIGSVIGKESDMCAASSSPPPPPEEDYYDTPSGPALQPTRPNESTRHQQPPPLPPRPIRPNEAVDLQPYVDMARRLVDPANPNGPKALCDMRKVHDAILKGPNADNALYVQLSAVLSLIRGQKELVRLDRTRDDT